MQHIYEGLIGHHLNELVQWRLSQPTAFIFG